jgi:hypothetical protein
VNIGEDEETQKASITEREGVRYLPMALLPGMLFVFQATSQRGSMHADGAGFLRCRSLFDWQRHTVL